jgi:hypothetical protein
MVTYILGAGASRHAGYPLANELGERLCHWVDQNWTDGPLGLRRGTIDELHKMYGGLADLERVLTELDERPANSRAEAFGKTACAMALSTLQIAIPEFFSSVRETPIVGRDLYRSLVQHHIRGGDAVVTFNYDLAVERALRIEGLWEIGDGYGFAIGDAITPSSEVKVLKLHGSTNWLGLLLGGSLGFSQVSSVYGPRPVLLRESDFSYLGYSNSVRDPHSTGISRTGGEPALILPTLHKNFFHQTSFGHEWEPFWNRVWGQAADALQLSKRIVIIGYSMPGADERARQLLLGHSNPNAEIVIFSGSRTHAISEQFRKAGFKNVRFSEGGRFDDFLSA